MGYQFRDVFDFQEQYRTKEERESKLLTMSHDEIMHLALSSGNVTAAIYYGKFALLARKRENDRESRSWKMNK